MQRLEILIVFSVCFVMKNLGLSVQRLSEKNQELERLQITVLMTQFDPSGKGILQSQSCCQETM